MNYLYAAIAVVLFGGGFYLGGLHNKDVLDHTLANQQATVAAALLAQRKISDAEEDRLNAIITKYENAPVDPLSVNVGTRVYHYITAGCAVPKTATPTSGVSGPAPVAANPDRVESSLNRYVSACSKEAAELVAIQAAWPK